MSSCPYKAITDESVLLIKPCFLSTGLKVAKIFCSHCHRWLMIYTMLNNFNSWCFKILHLIPKLLGSSNHSWRFCVFTLGSLSLHLIKMQLKAIYCKMKIVYKQGSISNPRKQHPISKAVQLLTALPKRLLYWHLQCSLPAPMRMGFAKLKIQPSWTQHSLLLQK